MKRYTEEKHIIENRMRLYKQLTPQLGSQHADYTPHAGRFRKALRCAGCGKPKCQLCHPEKFPKRIPTAQEKHNWLLD